MSLVSSGAGLRGAGRFDPRSEVSNGLDEFKALGGGNVMERNLRRVVTKFYSHKDTAVQVGANMFMERGFRFPTLDIHDPFSRAVLNQDVNSQASRLATCWPLHRTEHIQNPSAMRGSRQQADKRKNHDPQ